jgi:pyroglutamyl-peptidase
VQPAASVGPLEARDNETLHQPTERPADRSARSRASAVNMCACYERRRLGWRVREPASVCASCATPFAIDAAVEPRLAEGALRHDKEVNRPRPTVLLSGFEPLNRDKTNASQMLVDALVQAEGESAEIAAIVLPATFRLASDRLIDAVKDVMPEAAISFGQAWGRASMTVERVAVNLIDSWGEDNAGHQPVDELIAPDGPTSYRTRLPERLLVEAIQGVGVPASLSTTAGSHLCNEVFYSLMHHMATADLPALGGFIHVPWTPEQLAPLNRPEIPTMALPTMVRGASAAIAHVMRRESA